MKDRAEFNTLMERAATINIRVVHAAEAAQAAFATGRGEDAVAHLAELRTHLATLGRELHCYESATLAGRLQDYNGESDGP